MDGARVSLLQFEISGSTNGLRTVTNMTVRVSAIPSFLDCGNGKPTRFFGYRRQIGTERRLMAPRKLGSEKLDGTERLFVFEDADYDGSAEDRGKGSSAVILNEPARGQASINDSWTGEIHFWPNPSKPFRFALLDMAHVRIDNEALRKPRKCSVPNRAGRACPLIDEKSLFANPGSTRSARAENMPKRVWSSDVTGERMAETG